MVFYHQTTTLVYITSSHHHHTLRNTNADLCQGVDLSMNLLGNLHTSGSTKSLLHVTCIAVSLWVLIKCWQFGLGNLP